MSESSVHKLLPNETVLEDDYPVNVDYVYIADGVFTRCPIQGTVHNWKNTDGIKEIRRCDLFGHSGARLGDRVEIST